MGVRKYTAYTPSRKNVTGSDFVKITKSTPEKPLVVSKKKYVGRGAQGKITVRRRGDDVRRKHRIIDFERGSKDNVPAKVVAIEYDPNRTANIALPYYADGVKAYILAPQDLTAGQTMTSGDKAEARVGNYPPLAFISVNFEIHNIELYPGKGTQLTRTTDITTQFMAREGKYVTLRLPPGETRMVPINYRAMMGNVGSGERDLINLGKAGRGRRMGIRPTIRDSVMSLNDHPHGGGEGRMPISCLGPCTPQGKPAMGPKARKKNKQSSKLIVRKRNDKV